MSGAVGLNHVSVVARDLEESIRFYVDVLGLEPLPTPDFGFPAAGELQVHLFERPDEPPTHAHFAFTVDDIVGVYEQARGLGILEASTFGYAIAELPGCEVDPLLLDVRSLPLDVRMVANLLELARHLLDRLGEGGKLAGDGRDVISGCHAWPTGFYPRRLLSNTRA